MSSLIPELALEAIKDQCGNIRAKLFFGDDDDPGLIAVQVDNLAAQVENLADVLPGGAQ